MDRVAVLILLETATEAKHVAHPSKHEINLG